jgi:hypothetical protein
MKFALYYQALGRSKLRLDSAISRVSVGKMSGATGTMATFGPDAFKLQSLVMADLGLTPAPITTQILGVDAKRVHLVHDMRHGDTDVQLAVVEQMLVHVDMNAGRSAPILPHVAAALTAIAAAHAHLPVPPQVGSVMRLPPAKP